MLFQNIDFHNVEQMIPYEDGYRMCRLPEDIRELVNPGIRDNSCMFATGVELRFKLAGEAAVIRLRALPTEEAQMACLYYGSYQGGWTCCSYMIGREETSIRITMPENIDRLRELSVQEKLPFSPEVVRLVLPYGSIVFLGVDGEIVPPDAQDMPKRRYLAYGSSITHGSLALVGPYSYPFRIAQRLKCDYFNLGFAGTAQMEAGMAQYIVDRKDWDFASVEMGINMMGDEFDADTFEKRIDTFTGILAKDSRPIFATSIFGFPCDLEKVQVFRSIVEKYARKRLIFTDGLELLHNDAYVSQDLVHPSLEGMEVIVDQWHLRMKDYLESHTNIL